MSGTTQTVGATGTGEGAAGLLERIRKAFDVLLFRSEAVDDVLADEGAFVHALAIVALAGVAIGVGRSVGLPGVVGFAVAQLITSFLLAGVIHLSARLALGAEQDFIRFYRVFGLTYLLFWLSGIPVVHALFRWVLWAWQIGAIVLVAERAYRLERVQAALVVGIPILVGMLALALFNGMVALAALVTGSIF